MKKFYPFLGLAIALPLLANCANNPKITITNKIDSIGYAARTYQLEVETKNLGDANLIYTSSELDVATISDDGMITFLSKGDTTIKVASSLNENVNDSFNLKIETTYIEGVVSDENGNAIEGAHVSYGNTISSDTASDGSYSLPIEDLGNALYFEKFGYQTSQYVPTIEDVYATHELNITLITGTLNVVTVKGKVTNIDDDGIVNVNLSIKKSYNDEYFTTITDAYGNFEFKDIFVGQSFVIESFNNEYNHSLTTVDVSDVDDINITLEPYQEEMMFSLGEKDLTTGNDKMILGHVYRRDLDEDGDHDTLVFNFEATYAAFVPGNEYRICIDAGTAPASPLHKDVSYTEDTNDFDIGFTATGITTTEHYGGTFGSGNASIKFYSEYRLDVEIPYEYANAGGLRINDESPIGIYFDSSRVSAKNRCAIYGHSMTEENQLSYIRLDENNVAYAGTDNKTPDNVFISNSEQLTWDTMASLNWKFATYNDSPIIGQVGNNFNYGYQFKVAKRGTAGGNSDTGIYILAKMRMSEMNGYFLEDSWKPNIYIDSNVNGETYDKNTIDADINRYAMISNYSIERSFPKDSGSPFNDTRSFLDEKVYGLGVRYYTNRDLAIIYIPYAGIVKNDGTTTLTNTDNFGLALNLNYKSSEWYSFQGHNPTGYIANKDKGDYDNTSIPHFENRLSYIHFKNDLSIISFPPRS